MDPQNLKNDNTLFKNWWFGAIYQIYPNIDLWAVAQIIFFWKKTLDIFGDCIWFEGAASRWFQLGLLFWWSPRAPLPELRHWGTCWHRFQTGSPPWCLGDDMGWRDADPIENSPRTDLIDGHGVSCLGAAAGWLGKMSRGWAGTQSGRPRHEIEDLAVGSTVGMFVMQSGWSCHHLH